MGDQLSHPRRTLREALHCGARGTTGPQVQLLSEAMTTPYAALERCVGVWTSGVPGHPARQPMRYPSFAPFHPAEAYPEAPFPELAREPNAVYAALRELF